MNKSIIPSLQISVKFTLVFFPPGDFIIHVLITSPSGWLPALLMCPRLKSLPPQLIPFCRTSPDTPFPQELSPTAPVSSCLHYFTCQFHRIWKHVFHPDISVFFKLQLVLPTNPPKGINIIFHKPIYGPVFPSKYITYHSQKRLPRKVVQFDLKVGRVEYQDRGNFKWQVASSSMADSVTCSFS